MSDDIVLEVNGLRKVFHIGFFRKRVEAGLSLIEEIRRRLLDLFLAAHTDVELELLGPEGEPVGGAVRMDRRSRQSVMSIVTGDRNEVFWLETVGGSSRMRGFKRVVAADRCGGGSQDPPPNG